MSNKRKFSNMNRSDDEEILASTEDASVDEAPEVEATTPQPSGEARRQGELAELVSNLMARIQAIRLLAVPNQADLIKEEHRRYVAEAQALMARHREEKD